MGNVIQRASFEDVEAAQEGAAVIITVLAEHETVLIKGTVPFDEEVARVEHAIRRKEHIIVYGRNSNDEAVYKKYDQLVKLGGRPLVYTGGLFEWLLLQDIYGDRIQTTTKTLDLLKYRPPKGIKKYLTN
jgi:hypothetical protein